MPPRLMVHDKDPADIIREKVGDLSKFRLFGNFVLLGVYERPEKTASGLYLADQTRQEDQYQGKSALVLMKGRSAFLSDANYDFGDDNVEVGDWVMVHVSDGRKLTINGQLSRIVEDHQIRLKIPAPDVVF